MNRPPIVGYAPFQTDLTKVSNLERFDVVAIIAATTLLQDDEFETSLLVSIAVCDIGFADAQKIMFEVICS